MKNLPISIQTLAKIRENDCVFVDKTEMVTQLVKRAGAYFLSRPRRFGKSLLLDTFKELFEGNRALFQGLYIEDKWDWSKIYPVLRFDFSEGHFSDSDELEKELICQLKLQMKHHGVECKGESAPALFRAAIQAVQQKYQQQVVVLIDEYDKPIRDNICDPKLATEIQRTLNGFYSVLKSQSAHIQFLFIAGVTKPFTANMFGGLNHLQDISLDRRYSTICGYTKQDLTIAFSEYLADVDWQQLELLFGGYHFDGETVYKPSDILAHIDRTYKPDQSEIDSEQLSILLERFRQQQYSMPEEMTFEVGEETLGPFDVERVNPITLMYQMGYLALDQISETGFGELCYQLKVPNQTTRTALRPYFT